MMRGVLGVSARRPKQHWAFAGGDQIGRDYQFSGGWMVGIRNMFDGTTNNHDATLGIGPLAGGVVNFKN